MRVPDAGFPQLIARLAAEIDPTLVTTAQKPVEQPVTDEVTESNGSISVRHRFLTQAERGEFAEMTNGYLADAGVEEVPADEVLYLTLPDGVADMDELCRLLLQDVDDQATDHPSQMADALREVLPRRYR